MALREGEDSYNPDLSDATLLEDPSFFENARESIQEWLRSEHFGLYGWIWVAFAGAALFLFCCACSFCTNWSKRRKAQKAVRRELDSHLNGNSAPRAQAVVPGGRQAPRGASHKMPSGWDLNPREVDEQNYAAPPPGYPPQQQTPPGYHAQQTEIYSHGSLPQAHAGTLYCPSRSSNGGGSSARNDPLAAPAF